MAPVRFCHRGYPASTETPYLINLVESALEPISPPPRREGESWPGIPRTLLSERSSERSQLTSDAGTILPKKKDPAPTLPSWCDPLPIRAFGAVGMQNASEQHFSLPNGDHPDAEAPEQAITVLPVKGDHPAHSAKFESLRIASRRAHRVSGTELDPAKGEPRHQPEVPFTERPDPVWISRRGAHPCPECPCGPSGGSLSSSGLFHRPIAGNDASLGATPPLSAFLDQPPLFFDDEFLRSRRRGYLDLTRSRFRLGRVVKDDSLEDGPCTRSAPVSASAM